MKIYWYAVKFPDGQVYERVVDDPCDTVQLHNVEFYFESEAYHISGWAAKNNLAYEEGVLDINIPHTFK